MVVLQDDFALNPLEGGVQKKKINAKMWQRLLHGNMEHLSINAGF